MKLGIAPHPVAHPPFATSPRWMSYMGRTLRVTPCSRPHNEVLDAGMVVISCRNCLIETHGTIESLQIHQALAEPPCYACSQVVETMIAESLLPARLAGKTQAQRTAAVMKERT